jgi:hypothetical protein
VNNEQNASLVLQHVEDILKSRAAPEYGTFGVDITFHAGVPVKISKTISVSLKPPEATKQIVG